MKVLCFVGEMEQQQGDDSSVDYIQTSVDLENNSTYTNATDNYDISASIKTRKSSIGYDLPPKVNLYSENILQEEDASENIDRCSIADLGNIKENWENRSRQSNDEKTPSVVKKLNKVVRHWSVKLNDPLGRPTKNKKTVVADTSYNDNQIMSSYLDSPDERESAIEREIRLSLEREESLKQEQELRLLRQEKEMETRQDARYQSNRDDFSSNEHFQPTYLEMTEADRAHEITKRENDLQLEPEVPKNYKNFNHTTPNTITTSTTTINNNNNDDDHKFISVNKDSEELMKTPIEYRETVVQAEIRMQREREREMQLTKSNKNNNINTVSTTDNSNNYNSDNYTIKIDSNNFDYAASSSSQDTDHTISEPQNEEIAVPLRISQKNKIAEELRAVREREAELKEVRQSLLDMKITKEAGETRENVGNECMVDGNISGATSTMSCDTEKANCNVENSTAAAAAATTTKTTTKTTKVKPNETPIEREIRLAQERETQFRIDKGVPVEKKPSVVVNIDKTSHVKPKYSLKNNVMKGDTMKKIATNRLQEEIKKEVKREVSLRNSGRINTTSVERIGEQKKYTEVSPVAAKRNFTTVRKSSVASADSNSGEVDSVDSYGSSSSTAHMEPHKTSGPNFVIQKPKISTVFSYREAKSNASSIIEQELREMKEREEELKSRRRDSISQSSVPVSDTTAESGNEE